MRFLIYDSQNVQLLDFHAVTLQLSPRKVPEVFLVCLPIYCNGASKSCYGQNMALIFIKVDYSLIFINIDSFCETGQPSHLTLANTF